MILRNTKGQIRIAIGGLLGFAAIMFILYVYVYSPQSGITNPDKIGMPILYAGIAALVIALIIAIYKAVT